MDFFRELRELRGNQGREEEEERVISVEPIAMIVPPALQNLPETITPESSANSSARDDSGNNHASPSSSLSSEETPSHGENTGDVAGNVPDLPVVREWESRIITGRLSNLRKVPKDLLAGFRFRAALHHEVANGAPSISGYKKLKEMVMSYQIPRTILLRAGTQNERACTVSQTGWIPVFYAVVCEVGDTGQGDSVQVIIPMSAVPKLQRRKVVLPLWEGEEPALQEQEMSSILERQHQRAQGSRGRVAGSASQRQTWFDERPPLAPQSRCSSHRGSSSASRARAERKVEAVAPSARRRALEDINSKDEVPLMRRRTTVETAPASTTVLAPQIAYPEGFSYVKTDCQPAMVQGMQSFVPPVDPFSYAVALFESAQGARTQNSGLNANCKQLATEKASLVDNVNRLQGFEMATRVASVESRAEELASRNNELKEELERAHAEKESRIQATKDEATHVEERAKKAEAERDHTLNELSSLRQQVAEAAKSLNKAEEALNRVKTSQGHFVSIARAQGAEWLVGSAAFQDAVAVASANMTTEIYNKIYGKVLQHRPDFPICELAFFDGEDLDKQGKSLAPLADATVLLRWELNEKGVPIWPPSVLEEGGDPEGLPSFDSWVERALVAEPEPSSTPPNSQPAVVLARSPITTPAREPAAQSSPARASGPPADAFAPIDLTDD
ncbi:hypothetical protein SLEP1_g25699 [Rubroshorea leprosula]|uniref:Uncharacterized protein n=1 Tax=Rubroshorea leprosula TaxID=152421 RepID=A0AAV5JR49_9ROSI|nr:hypothetical protein SLEP1_g25699 [Rubroshorea leprosula]